MKNLNISSTKVIFSDESINAFDAVSAAVCSDYSSQDIIDCVKSSLAFDGKIYCCSPFGDVGSKVFAVAVDNGDFYTVMIGSKL